MQQGQSNAYSAAQGGLIKRQSKLFDTINGIVKTADQNGQFDPTKQINLASADMARAEGADTLNAAGAARVLGYQPGDSEPQRQEEAIGAKAQVGFAALANSIRQNAFGQRLSAYNSINPGSLNQGIQSYGQMAQASQPNMGGFFQSLAPYLAPKPPAPYYGGAPAGVQSLGGALSTGFGM